MLIMVGTCGCGFDRLAGAGMIRSSNGGITFIDQMDNLLRFVIQSGSTLTFPFSATAGITFTFAR